MVDTDYPSTEGRGYGRTVPGTGPEVVATFSENVGAIAVIAEAQNSSEVYIGFDDNLTQSNGFQLQAGQSISMSLNASLETVYVLATNQNDAVRWIAIN